MLPLYIPRDGRIICCQPNSFFCLLSSFINVTWTYVTVAHYMCGRKRDSALQQTIYFFTQWMKNLRQFIYVYFILIQLKTVNCTRYSPFHKTNCRSVSQETPRVLCCPRDLTLIQNVHICSGAHPASPLVTGDTFSGDKAEGKCSWPFTSSYFIHETESFWTK